MIYSTGGLYCRYWKLTLRCVGRRWVTSRMTPLRFALQPLLFHLPLCVSGQSINTSSEPLTGGSSLSGSQRGPVADVKFTPSNPFFILFCFCMIKFFSSFLPNKLFKASFS